MLICIRKYMLRTFPEVFASILANQRGLGLITALFTIVVVGMFGVLIGRYVSISSVSSAEDYYWAQALYSAQSAAQLRILYDDNGGVGARNINQLAGFAVDTDTVSVVSGIRASAERNLNNTKIRREIEVHVAL